MTKLIASDVDGTLTIEGTNGVNPQLFQRILELKEQGITFVAASGRQYASMKQLFEPVLNDILFIADNGAYVWKEDKMLVCNTIEEDVFKEIVAYVHTLPDVFVMYSTNMGSYTDCKDQAHIDMIRNGYGLKVTLVDNILDLDVKVSKVAVHCEKVDAVQLASPAKAIFGQKATVVASGAHWIDFMKKGVDKGRALAWVQRELNITEEQTIAFGDNINDIGLLKQAKNSYAVAGARDQVKAVATHVLQTDAGEDCVLHEIEHLFRLK